jgi:hypothetical protein
MKQPAPKNIDRQKITAVRIAIQRKKLIAALVLVVIMAALWIKILGNKSRPAAVSAAAVAEANTVLAQTQNPKTEYIELPYVSQRHNAIIKDCFMPENFGQFKKQDSYAAQEEQLNITDTTGSQLNASVAAAARQLELSAIVNDKTPQVFIGDKLFEKGQSFRFIFRGQTYRFKVLDILEDRVELDCNGIIITKKIPQSF